MRTHLPLRRTGLGSVVLLAIAAAVAVVLLLPGTASSKPMQCPSAPRPDGPVVPKQGPPGTIVEFHGSKMSNVFEVAFKGKGGLAWADWEYLGSGWIIALVPPGAVSGPIVVNAECGPAYSAQTQKFKVT